MRTVCSNMPTDWAFPCSCFGSDELNRVAVPSPPSAHALSAIGAPVWRNRPPSWPRPEAETAAGKVKSANVTLAVAERRCIHAESNRLIAITMGDPCGIGPEIIVKALQSPDVGKVCVPLVVGDRLAMERALSVCGSHQTLREILQPDEARSVPAGSIPLLALSQLTDADMVYGAPSAAAGDAVYRYICHAAQLCLEGQAAAMATAPISKEAMHRAGHDYPGHTELLAELCGTDDFVMMLAGDILRVSLVTIHEALAAMFPAW